ncbi:hypothetical protein [Tautonia rosea]|uniref:hypothetical protein n=1 Tax=Tautonia rosea TaxID=2728037 RepID=UPI0014740016|nr:hypothetical protein [Tautonia rosea]
MISADAYLHLPDAYARWLGGLRWSVAGEALEFPDGKTFVFSRELSLFLDGFATGRDPIHFAHLLHLMHLLLRGPLTLSEADDFPMDLPGAFSVLGRPHRNAGAFCAMLCEGVPSLPDPPEIETVCLTLTAGAVVEIASIGMDRPGHVGLRRSSDRSLRGRGATPALPLDDPPMTPAEFERWVLDRLIRQRPEAIRHWLRVGRGPEQPAEALADRIEHERPRTYRSALEPLLERPRLSASALLIDRLVGALALPPRRRSIETLPTGGYADLANRGAPERLLLSQLAIDAEEFVRRFAERELLYYQREEPHAEESETLVVLLDQGVRTWGGIRTVLAAAVVALAGLADRRGVRLLLGVSSDPTRRVDPIRCDPEQLAALLEASELSPHPNPLLDSVVSEGERQRRDLVLLTHPKTLEEPEIEATARGLAEGDRLFAVLVNDRRDVQVAEVRRGRPVILSRFRAEPIDPPTTSPPPDRRRPRNVPPGSWIGDVEPIGFPFRLTPAVDRAPRGEEPRFAFDASGEWFAVLGRFGVPHLWRLNGSVHEPLPRGFSGGEVVREADMMIGVAGGFVVLGRIGEEGRPVAVHYDLVARRVRVFVKYLSNERDWTWFYLRESHALVARGSDECWYLDLRTGGRFSSQDRSASEIVSRDLQRVEAMPVAPPSLVTLHDDDTSPSFGPSVRLRRESGTIAVEGMDPPWRRFRPVSEGRPLLQGHRLEAARCCGQTLAIFAIENDATEGRWWIFRKLGADLVPIVPTAQMPRRRDELTLSSDGSHAALRCEGNVYAVYALESSPVLLLQWTGGDRPARRGDRHRRSRMTVSLGRDWILLQDAPHAALIHWEGTRLGLRFARGDPETVRRELFRNGGPAAPGLSEAAPGPLPPWARYDPDRFEATARGLGLVAVVDAFGQVVLADASGTVLALLAFSRGSLAAWLPDGARFGSIRLTGTAATPGAEDRLASALRLASRSSPIA